jgi:hypothetical protein
MSAALLPQPRLVSAARIRAYIGVDGASLKRMRDHGVIPGPVPGTRKYDFLAVKTALDRLSNPDATMAHAEEDLIKRARQWGKSG